MAVKTGEASLSVAGLKLSKPDRKLLGECASAFVRQISEMLQGLQSKDVEEYSFTEMALLREGLLRQAHEEPDPARGMKIEKLYGKLNRWIDTELDEEEDREPVDEAADIVPAHLLPMFEELTALTDKYCREFLDEQCADLCRKMAGMLCQPGTPASRGKREGWAAGVVHTVGWTCGMNYATRHLQTSVEEVAQWFQVSTATVYNKHRTLREGLELDSLSGYGWAPEAGAEEILDRFGLLVDGEPEEAAGPGGAVRLDATLAYQLKITLDNSKPPIWRRVCVDDCTLETLHEIIQDAMGWFDSHLHEFQWGEQRFFQVENEDMGIFQDDDAGVCEADVTLGELVARGCKKLKYWYDFGDDWMHTIQIEKTYAPSHDETLPRCTAGAMACPPEDCGGVWGYYPMLEALADPKHENHADIIEWIGEDFDPNEFGVEEVNKLLWGGE